MRTGRQWITTRRFTAIIASALVSPTLVLFYEAFRLRSMALLLTGVFLLLFFGVPYYILLCWFLQMDTAARPSVTNQFSIVDLEEHKVSPTGM